MENQVPQHLMETGESFAQKYQPVLDFEGWRVAILRYMADTDYDNLQKVERHQETNEVFILTHGKADMIVCNGEDKPDNFYVFPMRINVAYNFYKGVWHHVLMSEDAHIILVEKTNTTLENTDYYDLSDEDIQYIKRHSQFKRN